MRIINLKKLKKPVNTSLLITIAIGVVIIFTLIFYFGGGIKNIVGSITLTGSIFLFSILFFKTFHSDFFKNVSLILLTGTILILGLFSVILIETASGISYYFIPVGAAAILLTVLSKPAVAVLCVFVISILAGVMGNFSFEYFYVAVAGGLAGVYSSLNVRRRRDLNRCGLYILIVNTLAIVSMDMLTPSGMSIASTGINIGWGAGNALISVIIASGLLHIFESIFSITTDINLLELGDFNQPVLKKLMLEAPGTYHHSLMVGNLAENACRLIGANPLLARVGAYYHDIGKLKKPHYFIENRTQVADKHKKLSPNISALILKRHVKDGLAYAESFKLPQIIKDMIIQHHGKTLIEYFYKKVVKKTNGETSDIDEKDYRYPGPRPQSKEAGVLMLADSVEAACRVLDEPTFSRIAGLVRKVINNKFTDSQLNNCDITLANLEAIHESFTNTLAGIYHSRIEYPEDKEETEQ